MTGSFQLGIARRGSGPCKQRRSIRSRYCRLQGLCLSGIRRFYWHLGPSLEARRDSPVSRGAATHPPGGRPTALADQLLELGQVMRRVAQAVEKELELAHVKLREPARLRTTGIVERSECSAHLVAAEVEVGEQLLGRVGLRRVDAGRIQLVHGERRGRLVLLLAWLEVAIQPEQRVE